MSLCQLCLSYPKLWNFIREKLLDHHLPRSNKNLRSMYLLLLLIIPRTIPVSGFYRPISHLYLWSLLSDAHQAEAHLLNRLWGCRDLRYQRDLISLQVTEAPWPTSCPQTTNTLIGMLLLRSIECHLILCLWAHIHGSWHCYMLQVTHLRCRECPGYISVSITSGETGNTESVWDCISMYDKKRTNSSIHLLAYNSHDKTHSHDPEMTRSSLWSQTFPAPSRISFNDSLCF